MKLVVSFSFNFFLIEYFSVFCYFQVKCVGINPLQSFSSSDLMQGEEFSKFKLWTLQHDELLLHVSEKVLNFRLNTLYQEDEQIKRVATHERIEEMR